MKAHYTGKSGEKYFRLRQRRRTDLAQAESASIFKPYVHPEMTVIDFGCGTGGILSRLSCKHKVGVEVNEESIQVASLSGLTIYSSASELPPQAADLAISHHALEHVEKPYSVLVELRQALKVGGMIVIVVPGEDINRRQFRRWHSDPNLHLYSWNPLSLGNLLIAAGFRMLDGRVVACGYSRYIDVLRPIPPLFSFGKKVVAKVLSRYSTLCVAIKP